MNAPRLKRFVVMGWALQSPAASNTNRIPFKHMTVSATGVADAQATYARCMGIRSEWWRDGSQQPMVVIRAVHEKLGTAEAR